MIMSLSNKRRLLLVVGVSVTLLVLAIIGVLISIKGRTEASTPPPLSSGVRTFSPAPGLAGSIMIRDHNPHYCSSTKELQA